MSDDKILIPGTLRGYRFWNVGREFSEEGEYTLWPVAKRDMGPWVDGENVAACPVRGSRVPYVTCKCGIYAKYQLSHWDNQPHLVPGVIEAYGRIIVAERGFRAQKARILAITVPEWWRAKENSDEIVSDLRASYPSVQIFDRWPEMLEEFPEPGKPRELFGPEAAAAWPEPEISGDWIKLPPGTIVTFGTRPEMPQGYHFTRPSSVWINNG